jgi:hypothetical protein
MIKVTKDNFIWKIVTHKARQIYQANIFELYILHHDDTESLVRSLDDIGFALLGNKQIGIEVGQLDINVKQQDYKHKTII